MHKYFPVADTLEGETSVEDTTQKQLNTRHQLQRKLQERREITRQKQRMEEERSHLATQESRSASTKQAPAQTPRNPMPGISRTPGPRFDVDRNAPRRPSVPTILPKTLLPKGLVGARLDLDPRAQRRVDPPQFILLSPSASQLQPGQTAAAGSLVFISSSMPPALPTADARIQAVVTNVGVTQAGRTPGINPSWFDLPCGGTSDLVVVSTSSVAAPILAESCYGSNQTRPLMEAGRISQVFPGTTEKYINAGGISVVCSVANSYVRPVCPDVIAGSRQGNQFVSSLVVGSGDIIRIPPVSQEVRSPASAAVDRSSAPSVHDLTVPLTPFSSSRESASVSLPLNSDGFFDDGHPFGVADNYTKVSDGNYTSQNPDLPTSSHLELPIHLEQQLRCCEATVNKPATRTANPAGPGSKGRGRSVPSRSSTKTVSSILDEQRCSGLGGSRAMKFYNDSRNVSQILKELREKGYSSTESDQGTGVSTTVLDRNATPNPFVCNPVIGIVPPNFQIVQVLPPSCSGFKSTDKVIQSSSVVQPPAAIGSSTASVDGPQMVGDLRSPIRRQPTGLLSEVLLSSKSVLHLPHLVVPAPATTNTDSTIVIDQEIMRTGSGLLKDATSSLLTVNPEWGATRSTSQIKHETFLHVTVSTSGVETGGSISRAFVSPGILQADSRKPLVETLKFLGVPVIMSTSESQPSSVQSSCVNLQQLFLQPLETIRTSSENSALFAQQSYGVSVSQDTGGKLGQVNVGRSTDNNRTRSSGKRSIDTQKYCGIKKLLLGDDRPERVVDRPPVTTLEYFAGEMGRMETDRTDLNRVHSPGDEKHPMPYKDSFAQHCTLQQLSQASTLRMLQQQARLRQQAEPQSKQGGSRPASAFGDDKTGLVSQGTRPNRPNTVAGGILDGVINPETCYLDPTSVEEGSPGSEERSTPLSGLSPRSSNLSSCSLYLDQTNAFMPIHITDSHPSVTAIKPMPTLGHRQRFEMEGFVISRPADARSLAAPDARGFVPYTSTESPRLAQSGAAGDQSGGFAPASSIRPLKKGSHGRAPSRQRHHSAHDFQNSCNKIPQEIHRLQEAYDDSSRPGCSSPPVPISMQESSAFGGDASSGLGILPRAMMPPVFDFQDLDAAGEVEEIISGSQESPVGVLAALQRSQSEPANCFQAGCSFTLEEMIDEMLNEAGTDSSATTGSAQNLSSHGSHWSDCSNKCRAPAEKLDDPSNNGEQLPWSSSSRDRLISGVELRPALAFTDGLHCGDLNSSEFGAFEHSAGSFIGEGCTPPLSQNSSPEEFTGEMPLFDKPDKDLEAFPPDGSEQSTALDTPNSLEGLFGAICGDDGESHGQSTGCNMDFTWTY